MSGVWTSVSWDGNARDVEKLRVSNLKSEHLASQAKSLIPIGAQTFSKAPMNFPDCYPRYLKSGLGAHVTDVDGNAYLDLICGLATIILGYRDWRVDAAIRKQLIDGINFSLPHPMEVYLAKQLHRIIPCAEQVRYAKTGTEACMAAVRIARAATGREHIAHYGYHGWGDWYVPASERPDGVPGNMKEYIHPFQYNDTKSLALALINHRCAAVIMEPVIFTPPDEGFLQEVKNLAHEYRALLVFDETVTGFRIALGGAQEYFGVTPDLAVLGKAMGNGMPIAAVVGSREIMSTLESKPVFFSGTYHGETLSLAAAIATIDRLQDGLPHIWEMGTQLIAGLRAIGYRVIGYPPRFHIELDGETPELRSLFMQTMLQAGVLTHSVGVNLCAALTPEDVKVAIDAYATAFGVLESAKTKGNICELLVGNPIAPPFRRA